MMETISIDQNNVINANCEKQLYCIVLYCVGTPCQLHHTTQSQEYTSKVFLITAYISKSVHHFAKKNAVL